MTTNSSIKLPSDLYIGFHLDNSTVWDRVTGQYVNKGSVMRAIMTPHGEDAAAKKRMRTIDNNRDSSIESKVMPNDTQAGFKLLDVTRHYGNEDWWRVLDPRGFQIEITSRNVSKILADCTVENSEIQEPCLWGRDGGTNVLIPITSNVYEMAKANQDRVNTKIGLKDIELGDTILLHNNDTSTYLGVVWIYEKSSNWRWTRNSGNSNDLIDDLGWVRKHCFIRDRKYGSAVEIYFPSSQMISKVVSKKAITDPEREKIISDAISNKQVDYPWGKAITEFSLTKQKVYKK